MHRNFSRNRLLMNLVSLITPLEQAIQQATASECPLLLGLLERLKGECWLKMQTPSHGGIVAGPETYTIPEVAAILKLSEYRCYELARQGKLPHNKIGKSVRVTAAQLAAFQKGQERT